MIKVVEIQKKQEDSATKRQVQRFKRSEVRQVRRVCRRSKQINRISTDISVPAFAERFGADLKGLSEMSGRLVNELTKSIASGSEQPDYISLKEAKRLLGFWQSVHGYVNRRLAAAKK